MSRRVRTLATVGLLFALANLVAGCVVYPYGYPYGYSSRWCYYHPNRC